MENARKHKPASVRAPMLDPPAPPTEESSPRRRWRIPDMRTAILLSSLGVDKFFQQKAGIRTRKFGWCLQPDSAAKAPLPVSDRRSQLSPSRVTGATFWSHRPFTSLRQLPTIRTALGGTRFSAGCGTAIRTGCGTACAPDSGARLKSCSNFGETISRRAEISIASCHNELKIRKSRSLCDSPAVFFLPKRHHR